MQRLRLVHFCGLVMMQTASAQIISPTVQWQRTFGGTGEEELHSAVATPDGGLLIAGYSMSGTNDLKTSPNFGLVNFWVIRVDSSGNRLWDKTYGGYQGDYLVSAAATADGGFILGGPSRSLPGGNKTAPSYGTNNIVDADYWIVKIDRDGNKLWDRSFGGIADDQLWNLRQTRDGGFILAGYSRSPASGNKTASEFGKYDYGSFVLTVPATSSGIAVMVAPRTIASSVWPKPKRVALCLVVAQIRVRTETRPRRRCMPIIRG